jgi:hypothetical protein
VLGCRVGRHVYSWPPHHTVPAGWRRRSRTQQQAMQAASGKRRQASKQPSGKRQAAAGY